MSVYELIKGKKYKYDKQSEPKKEKEETAERRLSDEEFASLPADTKDLSKARVLLSDYFLINLKGNYSRLETDCDIKRDTFQKAINFRSQKAISYRILEKFCIGAKVPAEEAKELFKLCGYILNTEEVRYDDLLIKSLLAESDLIEYNENVIKAGFEPILK